MDPKLIVMFIGIVSGVIGYIFTIFFMQPILRYRELRNNVLSDFIYFAQVINADGLNDDMKKLFRERILANRKMSSQLQAAILCLPTCYLWYLKSKGYDPENAAKSLIGYSNTEKCEEAHKIESNIRRLLGLPKKT